MERGVITEIPLHVLQMFSGPFPISSRPKGVTSHTNYQLAPPPSPPPKGRGVITEIPLWTGCRLLVASLLVSSLAVTFCVFCMPEAFCGIETVGKWVLLNLWVLWEKEMSFLRDKTPQRVAYVSSHRVGAFSFSQIYTEEQNTRGFTEALRPADSTERYTHL